MHWVLHFFLLLNNIPLCGYTIFIYSSVVSTFWFWMNIFLFYVPRRGIPGSTSHFCTVSVMASAVKLSRTVFLPFSKLCSLAFLPLNQFGFHSEISSLGEQNCPEGLWEQWLGTLGLKPVFPLASIVHGGTPDWMPTGSWFISVFMQNSIFLENSEKKTRQTFTELCL